MNETFGQRFVRLRKAKGLKQEDIANKINISPQAVSKWENDISSPDISILPELSEILGVSLDELLGKKKEDTVEVLPETERKDPNKLIMRILVTSKDGDRVKVNLPVSIIKPSIELGLSFSDVVSNGKLDGKLQSIDFASILALVEKGVIGELVSVDSSEGDHVSITVE